MGVYGSAAPLNSHDIDYDTDDTDYVLCSNCDEEYTQEELGTLTMSTTWQDNVCEHCRKAYQDLLTDLLDEAHAEAQRRFLNLEVNR